MYFCCPSHSPRSDAMKLSRQCSNAEMTKFINNIFSTASLSGGVPNYQFKGLARDPPRAIHFANSQF